MAPTSRNVVYGPRGKSSAEFGSVGGITRKRVLFFIVEFEGRPRQKKFGEYLDPIPVHGSLSAQEALPAGKTGNSPEVL